MMLELPCLPLLISFNKNWSARLCMLSSRTEDTIILLSSYHPFLSAELVGHWGSKANRLQT